LAGSSSNSNKTLALERTKILTFYFKSITATMPHSKSISSRCQINKNGYVALNLQNEKQGIDNENELPHILTNAIRRC
jgi:hypothetical protein